MLRDSSFNVYSGMKSFSPMTPEEKRTRRDEDAPVAVPKQGNLF